MPQLDHLIIPSQLLFFFFFFLGYLVFLKYILPIISFEMKLKELVELTFLQWFDRNQTRLIQVDKTYLELIKSANSLLKFISYLIKPKRMVFGILYKYDLLLLRSKYRVKNDNRAF